MQKGFTLIELLIVVLIIGVLAAVAIPKYNKAVLRSRATEGLIHARVLRDAAVAWQLQQGNVSADNHPTFNDLDIEFPGVTYTADGLKAKGRNWYYDLSNTAAFQMRSYAGTVPQSVRYEFSIRPASKTIFCYAGTNDPKAKDLCLFLGGVYKSTTTVWDTYQIIK